MGRFVVKRVKTGLKFDLKAANGEVIATSEVYKTPAACKSGIESVRAIAPSANFENLAAPSEEKITHPKFEMYVDRAGGYRFRLKAKNGEVIAVSNSYKAKASCENGIGSVRRNAPDAQIEWPPEEEGD